MPRKDCPDASDPVEVLRLTFAGESLLCNVNLGGVQWADLARAIACVVQMIAEWAEVDESEVWRYVDAERYSPQDRPRKLN